MTVTHAPDPPTGWHLWNEESDGRVILLYRPDIFSEDQDLPPECIPTLLISNGSRANRPGASQLTTDTWHAALTLEPDIDLRIQAFNARQRAIEGGYALAQSFHAGEFDFRDPYQVPREAYFTRLDSVLQTTE